MWFLRGGGGGGGAAAVAGRVFSRYFSRKRSTDLRRINPKVPREEATAISRNLYQIVKNNGPLSVSDTWNHTKVKKLGSFYHICSLCAGSLSERNGLRTKEA
ncbi:hypothetical protein BHE74_00014801 [Ensete ventricosum]|nr:hypothetical protein BHE74_00014801 [Ensete ventricosum]